MSNYAEIRSQIKSGDILLCSGSAVFSRLIQHVTNSKWSHVAFIIRVDEIDRVMVMESVESIGIRTVPLSSYMTDYNGSGKPYPGTMCILRHSAFKSDEIDNLSKFAVDLLGHPYSNDDIVRIAMRISMNKLGLAANEELITPTNAFICSEYVHECYRSVGIEIPFDKQGFIAPADFYNAPGISSVIPVF